MENINLIEGKDSRPLLAWMSFIKLGDFILLTPSLQQVQKSYPGLVVAVPDLLWNLYCEGSVFENAIPSSSVIEYLDKYENKPLIVDLTYPLLEKVKIPEHHHKLKTEFFLERGHSTQAYQKALSVYFPKLSLSFETQPFMNLNSDQDILDYYNVKPFYYFTVHSGTELTPKNWQLCSFETTIEMILEKYPKITCLNLLGPKDQELFTDRDTPENFRAIRTDLQEMAHLLASSLFHIDSDSSIHHLAGALDVPSITVFGPTGPGTWSSITKRNFIHWGGSNCAHYCGGSQMSECKEKICLTSVKPIFLVESADRILSVYDHF